MEKNMEPSRSKLRELNSNRKSASPGIEENPEKGKQNGQTSLGKHFWFEQG